MWELLVGNLLLSKHDFSTWYFQLKKRRIEKGLLSRLPWFEQCNKFVCNDIWCKHRNSLGQVPESTRPKGSPQPLVIYNILKGAISRKMWLILFFFVIGPVTSHDTWPKSNVVLSETCSARLEYLYLTVDFLLLQSFDQKKLTEKYSLPACGYECHKGCTKRLSSVQTFCQWGNARQRQRKPTFMRPHPPFQALKC